jgi:hypothetical protein
MKLPWIAAIAAVSILAPFESAFAQEPPAARREWIPDAEQSRAGVEADFLHTTNHDISINIVTADVTAQIGVTKHLFLDADIPTGVLAANDNTTQSMFGNPFLGAHYAGRFNRRTGGYVGASFGIPVARASRSGETDQLGGEITVTRAFHDPGHFFPYVFPVAIRGGLELDLAPVIVQMEVSPGMFLGQPDRRLSGYVDTSASAALRAGFGLEGGLRVQTTFIIAEGDDHAQTALEPFVGYATPERLGLYARYGLLVPIDEPLGFGGNNFVTHRFSIGVKF